MCYAWRNNAIFRRACGSGGMYVHSKLFLRGYSLPYLMRVCPHQSLFFYYFYSKLNEVLKHILRNYEWSLSYILQIIFLLLPFTLHRKQLIHESSLENVLSQILFNLRSAQYFVWITGYLYQYQTFANFAKLGKTKN